ncbi:MAG: DUF5658 family protein [Clostridiales bacterium]|jgi:hypothetical protein|nr:DUF5658 family protein [Clostridiales bacterium]
MQKSKEGLLRWQLIGIGAFNITDYFLTLEALEKGHTEANPLLITIVNTLEFPLVKLILVPLLLYWLWLKRHRIGDSLTKVVWIPFFGYFILMVYFRYLLLH